MLDAVQISALHSLAQQLGLDVREDRLEEKGRRDIDDEACDAPPHDSQPD